MDMAWLIYFLLTFLAFAFVCSFDRPLVPTRFRLQLTLVGISHVVISWEMEEAYGSNLTQITGRFVGPFEKTQGLS